MLHNVTKINRLPSEVYSTSNRGRNVQLTQQSGDNIVVPQTPDNVKMRNQIEGYYNKYGDDFYEKMPTRLQEDYDYNEPCRYRYQ